MRTPAEGSLQFLDARWSRLKRIFEHKHIGVDIDTALIKISGATQGRPFRAALQSCLDFAFSDYEAKRDETIKNLGRVISRIEALEADLPVLKRYVPPEALALEQALQDLHSALSLDQYALTPRGHAEKTKRNMFWNMLQALWSDLVPGKWGSREMMINFMAALTPPELVGTADEIEIVKRIRDFLDDRTKLRLV